MQVLIDEIKMRFDHPSEREYKKKKNREVNSRASNRTAKEKQKRDKEDKGMWMTMTSRN